MRDFLLAPFLSLFSIGFYRRLLARRQGLGFLYVAYLSLLLSLCGTFSYRLYLLPVANQFVSWLGENLPELVFTREGIRMGIKEPLLLSHPEWGPLLYLDPTTNVPKGEDLEKAVVLLTRTKLAYRNPLVEGETIIQDVIPQPRQSQADWQDLEVTGDRLLAYWFKARPFLSGILFFSFFIGAYFWKLIAGFVYSLLGLFLNCFRRKRLPYRFVLNFTFFALTPVTLLQSLASLFPAWRIPLNFWTGLLITTLYLALGILGTREREAGAA